MRPGLDDALILSGIILAGLGLWHVNPWLVLVEVGTLVFLIGIVVRR